MRRSEAGYQTATFTVAVAFSLLLFTLFANVIVVQLGRGAIRAAVDDAARAGAREGTTPGVCQAEAEQRLRSLLPGQLGEHVTVRCEVGTQVVQVVASGRFTSWLPGVPDFPAQATGRSAREIAPT